MSRVPQPSSSRTPTKTATPARSRIASTLSANGAKTRAPASSTAKPGTPTKPARAKNAESEPSQTPLSIREQIALKRAEVKKAQSRVAAGDGGLEIDESPPTQKQEEQEDPLLRWSLREAIERGRSTGTVNLGSRSLPCIPSALYEIHLGITPDRLKLVPEEPVVPPADPQAPPKRGRRDAPAWFEAQDLQALKASNNEILELQHEISLFGSLKAIDFHKNKLTSLPDTIADLSVLTNLDLSYNALTSLPANLFSLPELSVLNLSHNKLTTLPFNAPFASGTPSAKQQTSTSFFLPTVTRATKPLPKLHTLDVSYNNLTASGIDLEIPTSLVKVDLSVTPLGLEDPRCKPLMQALGRLKGLKELRFENSEIGDEAVPPDAFPDEAPFPSLRVLDFGETRVTMEAITKAFVNVKQQLKFEHSNQEPPEGVIKISVGKKVIKELWELEIEQRARARRHQTHASGDLSGSTEDGSGAQPREVIKEDWEIEAEQGLLTEGGRRRARAEAAAAASAAASSPTPASAKAASIASLGADTPPPKIEQTRSPSPPAGFALSSPQYYNSATQSLTLPPSTPPSKAAGHARTFSLAVNSTPSLASVKDLVVPAPTLPLAVIAIQPFARTLRELVLVNRRMDRSFALPLLTAENMDDCGLLPVLEELDLEGCNLGDTVSTFRSASSSPTDFSLDSTSSQRSSEPILPLIARLFPSLRSVNLSYNNITSAALGADELNAVILASEEKNKAGLKHLRLRGNRITDVNGFQQVAEAFKGNRNVPSWKLDELDLRDNEISKLLPELGLLPLDVFLVDGNTFRVPQRRIWEREGTKGLLSWLRGRIE
ncbi:hypothetical protein AX16_002192 [Volvariella volvacea WC 439]|nr:hypothetical protein AX16_002192 [Volvariella volvacea WC 439]